MISFARRKQARIGFESRIDSDKIKNPKGIVRPSPFPCSYFKHLKNILTIPGWGGCGKFAKGNKQIASKGHKRAS